MSLKQP